MVLTEVMSTSALIVRVASRRFALPLGSVLETLRPLPVEEVPGTPPFVRGVATVRGEPAPVVRMARLLGEVEAGTPRRWVVVKAGGRRAVLEVDEVGGVGTLEGMDARQLPPLLAEANGDAVKALGRLDEKLLWILETSRIVPAEVAPDAAWKEGR